MGLRARLALFFVAITVVPLTVAVFALEAQIDRQLRGRAEQELRSVRGSATALIEAQRQRAGDLAVDLADDLISRGPPTVLAGGDPAAAQAWLNAQSQGQLPQRADFAVLTGPDGRVLAGAITPAQLAAGVTTPDAAALAAMAVPGQRQPPGVLAATRRIEVGGQPPRPLGAVVTGVWTDRALLQGLPMGEEGGAAFVTDGRVLAVDGAEPAAVPALDAAGDAVVTTEVDGRPMLLTGVPLGVLENPPLGGLQQAGDTALLLWTPLRSSGLGLTVVLLAAAVVLAGAIGWFLAGTVVAPVRRAADVARSVADGDLSQSLAPTGGRELADLATALNLMTAELAARLMELERSRDKLRRSLSRLGQTLSSSLDLNRTLAVVVETAMDTLGADRGALMLYTPERDGLYVKVGRGIGERPPRLRPGQGVAGHVARTCSPVRLPADADQVPAPVQGEPSGEHQLAVPMVGRGQVVGVLSLLRDDPARPFHQDDLDTIGSFAAQASVAIENVMLHQEAQRLSVTDSLTGLWNFRYFQQQADREMESATRFDRPMSLVIVDIDHFKDVNDRYGHQVGDEVLAEVARRIRDSTRVPDIVARYGGEEFVVLLPGTDLGGALATAERIRLAVSGPSVTASAGAVDALTISCSAGVAEFPRHGRTVAGLVRSADAAMYTAKRRGRNRVIGAGVTGIERPRRASAGE